MSTATTTVQSRGIGIRRGARIGRIVSYVAVTVLAVVYAGPFLWMISLSLKPVHELNQIPPALLPYEWRFENYTDALLNPKRYFPTYLWNTTWYVFWSVLGQILSSALVGFGFARIPFKGRAFLFTLVLSTMMLPSQVLLIPQFLLFKELGWLNSITPLVVPSFFGSAFFIFLLRQFFMQMPRELDEAAVMDGATYFDIFWRIMLPLSVPVLITVFALSFVSHWNDFYGPLIYINDQDKMVMAQAIRLFVVPAMPQPINLMMAASAATVLPVIVVFLFCQRHFVRGVAMTGLREG